MSDTKAPPQKLQPVVDDQNRPFWQGARNGVLTLQQCGDCRHVRYPISHVCPACLSERFLWTPLSGRGEVYSTIVFHQVYHPAWAGEVPYNVSLIQLAEGPRMFSNVVGVAPDRVRVGDAVEVVFAPLGDEAALPQFRISGQAGSRA